MFVKYWILVAICVVYAQSDETDRNGDRVLEVDIAKMKTKLSKSKLNVEYMFWAVEDLYQRLAPDDYKDAEDLKVMHTFMEHVLSRAVKHYADVEKEARATGVLKYTSSYLYIMNLVNEGREEIVEPIKRAILGSNEFDNATKAECVDLWTNITKTYLKTFRQLSKIEEANPEEFLIIEDTKGWNTIHNLMPADSPIAILNVSKEIEATIEQKNVLLKPIESLFIKKIETGSSDLKKNKKST